MAIFLISLIACPENCMTCTDGSTCTVCNDEYGLTADATCVGQ